MTQLQEDAECCGLLPEEHPPVFVAQHLSAYAFMRPRVVGQNVLEVGFGGGYGTAYLAEAAKEVVGVDIAPGNIPRAQDKYSRPNLTFRHFNGFNLPFPDSKFDVACAFQVIEHIPESQLLVWLTEIRRTLKSGGIFYVSTLNMEHNMKSGRPYEKLPYHEHEFTAEEFRLLLEKAFPRVEVFGLHYTLTHRLFRRLKKWGLNRLLPQRVNIIDRFFQQVTIRDFAISPRRLRESLDLICICRKSLFKGE